MHRFFSLVQNRGKEENFNMKTHKKKNNNASNNAGRKEIRKVTARKVGFLLIFLKN